ncbi:hypothetical protein DYB32_009577 [Aphanomyces invadans]|uniref:Protein kinase domain-containing protein n=1 Tax=Aphanomyces invadans TaxID=157072 RepID=A0A3R6VF10_9STRA|nr:hypothetical protein DYB32_009577 [Aphanomyces invadans]
MDGFSPESPTCGYGIGFTDQYKLGETLGTGNFSIVREALHKPSGQRYAIKCIKKSGLSNDELEALTTEVAVLKQSYYSEREARDLIKLLLEAIKYCHECNVVHRDLKVRHADVDAANVCVHGQPENLLLTSKLDDASIKLADFGFAKRVDMHDEGLKTACGTPGYVAPEILKGAAYGKSVDIWSIGVITFILLCGYPPFHDDNHQALFRKIRKGEFAFDSPFWDAISDDAKHFIKQMLVVDNKKRYRSSLHARSPRSRSTNVLTR